MNPRRIEKAFAKAKAEGRGAFVAYATAGFPDAEAGFRALEALADGGADVVEIGVPFSDPFADGPVIRSAAYKAIEGGMTLQGSIELAARLRKSRPDVAIVLFSYYNPIYSMGLEKFAQSAAAAGVDAVLAVDLPLEERDELLDVLKPVGLSFVPLIAPNTPPERIRRSAQGLENTFLYVMTVKGVTGARSELPADLAQRLEEVRSLVDLPVAAGFGISTKAQAEAVSAHADGFVVGSALVKRLAAEGELKGALLP